MPELFNGKSPAGFFGAEYKRVTKQNLPPSVNVRGILELTNLHNEEPDGLDMVDRVFMANGSYDPIRLGARAIRSYFVFRPYVDLVAKTTAGVGTLNQDLLMKNILAVTSGHLLRERNLCPTFEEILSQAVKSRTDLVRATLQDMQDAQIPYIDPYSEEELRYELLVIRARHQHEHD